MYVICSDFVSMDDPVKDNIFAGEKKCYPILFQLTLFIHVIIRQCSMQQCRYVYCLYSCLPDNKNIKKNPVISLFADF